MSFDCDTATFCKKRKKQELVSVETQMKEVFIDQVTSQRGPFN